MTSHFIAGIRTNDYVLIAADRNCFAYGALIIKNDHDKKFMLGDKLIMTCIGESGDVAQFGDWCKRNIQLYKLRYGYEITPSSCHYWIRKSIADALRTEGAYFVDTIVGGYDDITQKSFLGSVDYLGNGLNDQPYLLRGFGGNFCYSILDKIYNPNLTEEEGVIALKKCLSEVKRRFIVNLSCFEVVVINKDGYRHLENVEL